MRDLSGPLLDRLSSPALDGLVLRPDEAEPGAWTLLRRRRGTTTRLSSIPGDASDDQWHRAFASRQRGENLSVTLPRPFLTRQTMVPAAAADTLEQVLRYEMDRLTPFTIDDVLFSHRIRSRDPATGALRVDLAVVPKMWAHQILARLRALSISPAALEAPGVQAEGAIWRISMAHTDPARQARVRLGWRLGLGTCAALAATVLAVPLLRQSLALADVETRIASLRPGMTQVEELRRRIAAGSAGAGQIAAARARAAEPLRVLGILTDILPDDTFLTALTLRRDQVTMEGNSAAATKIIAAMAADPHLRNPAFAAPVLRAESGKDVFTIQAGLGP